MALRVYNTLTQKKEDFVPIQEGHVGMYVCGVTVYDMCHIGHARVYVAFDVIYRYLKHLGLDVRYVRNFTDVDDKIIKRANEIGEDPKALADRFIGEFYADMKALNVSPVDVEPRVTEHMDVILATIQRIIDNGFGYEADGHVFYDISAYRGYGKLSGRNLEDMRAGDRIEVDERKRSPHDFVLWKPRKEGEPAWSSPWGEGRPGWHIECSAMSAHHLGETFDIHGGGKDLIFPHHENEIAQSEGAHRVAPVRYWLHNGFVNVKNEGAEEAEKMSKSLGNFFTIRDVLTHYHPEAVRYFLLTTHYRSPITYSLENLDEATSRVAYVYETLAKIDRTLALQGAGVDEVLQPELIDGIEPAFREAMDDDFNAARAIGLLSDVMRFANEVADARDKATKKRRKATLERLRAALAPVFGVLGLFEDEPATVLEGIRARKLARLDIDAATIEKKIEERLAARGEKDFARADAIRDELQAQGIVLMDTPEGTVWKVE